METIKVPTKLSADERETVLVYDATERVWVMDTSVPKHFRKALKQGWTPVTEYVYEDGAVCAMALTAPEKAITIRNPNKTRVMSEKQMGNLQGHNDDDEDDEED
jgi:hypothetical protein